MAKRKKIIIVGGAILVAAAITVTLIFVIQQPEPELRTAIVKLVEGLVEVRLGVAENFIAALVDMVLSLGDELVTREDSYSVIEMDTGLVLVVAPQSSFTVKEMEGEPGNEVTRLLLNAGEVFSISGEDLPEGAAYEVETPAGIVGIRGSAMGAAYDPDTGEVEATCLTGKCSVTTDTTTLDLTGDQWVGFSSAGITVTPEPLTDDQLNRWGRAIKKSEQAGVRGVFDNQCTCFEGNLTCQDGTTFEKFPACTYFDGSVRLSLDYSGDAPVVRSAAFQGMAVGFTLDEVSGMLVEEPDGSQYVASAREGLRGLDIWDSRPGDPLEGKYTFTLLDATGSPIEDWTDAYIWSPCELEPPRNVEVVITPEQTVEVTWDPVSGKQNYGVSVSEYPFGDKLYDGYITTNSHTIPWEDFGGSKDTGQIVMLGSSLSQLPPGDYYIEVFADSGNCFAVDWAERVPLTRYGDTIDFFAGARELIPYGQAPARETQIVIDGQAEDWEGYEEVFADPSGDAEAGALDLTTGYAFVSQSALYVMLETADPGADVVQFDIDLWTPDRQYLIGWQPGSAAVTLADATAGGQDLGPAANSLVAFGEVLEARIDLRDLGLPEKVDLTMISVYVGECCGPEWIAADTWRPAIIPVINEVDPPPPSIPYGEEPEAETAIVVDGSPDDWAGREVVLDDPIGDARAGTLDLGSGYAFANQDALYLLVKVDDSTADAASIDVMVQADDRFLVVNWQPETGGLGMGSVLGTEYQDLGPPVNTSFALGEALEIRIDLEDLGLPETLSVKSVQVYVGECCGEDWLDADTWVPPRTPIVNEVDAPPPTIPYGEEPEGETLIVIDGSPDDWAGREVILDDPAGDAEQDALDLTTGYVFANQNALYALIEVVDPDATLVQIDFLIRADDRLYGLSWRPGEFGGGISDAAADWAFLGNTLYSSFALGESLEIRIDLRDLGLPETVSLKEIRVFIGECCGPEWITADVWQPPWTLILNEVDAR